jgi:hypothetical protein
MACSTASCSTCPEVGYTAAVRYGPLALELRYTACRQFASHTAGCSAERVNKYTLGQCCSSFDIADFRKGRRPQPDSSENRERRGRPLRTLETVSVETNFHIIDRRGQLG